MLARWAHYKTLPGERGVTHPLLMGRGCAVPFCLCNINTDFYTSPLWLLVLSIPVFDSPPPLQGASRPSLPGPGPLLSDTRWTVSHHLCRPPPRPHRLSCLPGQSQQMFLSF